MIPFYISSSELWDCSNAILMTLAEKVALFFTLNKAVLFSALNSIFVIDKIIMYNTRRITKCLFQIRFIQGQEIHKQFI